MKIHFCGAAQTVTGSQHHVSVNGRSFLLDCGLFQGRRQEALEKNQKFPFDPAAMDAVVLSHAHMDHSGNLPTLVKNGFKGHIHATPVTIELCRVMLRDSAHLQMHDIEFLNKVRRKQNLAPVKPLYTPEEAEAVMPLFVPHEYEETFPVTQGVEATFSDAGHILGSAGVLLEVNDRGRLLRVGFSGDVGRPHLPITRDPVVLDDLDALIVETTYGGRTHGSFEDVEEELVQIIKSTMATGGKIIIPAFAIGRTQLIVFLLHKLFLEDRIPEVPIFVDSPLAVSATDIYRSHLDLLDRQAHRIFLNNKLDPFSFRRLTYIQDKDASKKLNDLAYPHIIISASGMCEGGRVLHHLRNSVDSQNTMLLFIGYAAQHTLARKIMDGAKHVKILGEDHEIKCKIHVMDNFSAHADRHDILSYIRTTPPEKLKHIFLVHGEQDNSNSLIDAIRSQGYQNVQYPTFDTVCEI
ncbi:MAG: MBL fold metallo-hydrolase [Fibrobacteres bacterium]|nr:MBL fold metallo-hydrolase [Fibrobacterota bacterium]